MMFHILIAFSLIACGLTSTDDICSKDPSSVCEAESLQSIKSFPKTAEEFRIICGMVIPTLQCGVDYYEKCHSFPVDIEEFYKVLNAVYEMCYPESRLHKAIVGNLECFHNEIIAGTFNKCFEELSEEALQTQVEALFEEGHQEPNEEDEGVNIYDCLKMTNNIACRALETKEKCGTEAMDTFVEVVTKISLRSDVVCASEAVALLPAVIRLRELENDVQQDSGNMIQRFGKK